MQVVRFSVGKSTMLKKALCPRRLREALLAAAIASVAAGSTLATTASPSPPHDWTCPGPEGMKIEFATPGIWRCVPGEREDCSVCRNFSDRVGQLIAHCDGDSTQKRYSVAPGGDVLICCEAPAEAAWPGARAEIASSAERPSPHRAADLQAPFVASEDSRNEDRRR